MSESRRLGERASRAPGHGQRVRDLLVLMSMTPELFHAQVEAALHENARRIDTDLQADGSGPAHGAYDRHFLVDLVLGKWAVAARSGHKPVHREGYGAAATEGGYPERGSFIRMLVDGWDPQDPHGARLLHLDAAFCALELHGRPLVLQPGRIARDGWRCQVVAEAQVRQQATREAHAAEQTELERAFVAERTATGRPPRSMPHGPSLRGVAVHWEYALENDEPTMAAVCGHALGEPPSEVARLLAEGVRGTLASYDRGGHSNPFDHHDAVLTAVALDMESEALALVNAPKLVWSVPFAAPRATAIVAAVRYLLGETDAGWPGDLTTAGVGLTEGDTYDQWYNRNLANVAQLLVAIRWGESERFEALLDERTVEWGLDRERSGRIGPVTLLDRAGLGLCALARRHGMTVHADSVYLPLDVLGGGSG